MTSFTVEDRFLGGRRGLPVVRDRQALVSTLRALLGDLGLKRRAREAPTLTDYLQQCGGNQPSTPPTSSAREAPQTDGRAPAQPVDGS